MQLNQPVKNPAFISKLKQFDEDKTRKNELELIQELRQMQYLTPVTLVGKDENGRPAEKVQVKFRAATSTQGESFFAMFSDMDELSKWAGDSNDTMTLTYEELERLVNSQAEEIAGFVVNPSHQNLIIRKATMNKISHPFQQTQISPDMVVLSKPEPSPKKLIKAMNTFFKGCNEVLSAWLFQANYKANPDEPHFLVVISLTNGADQEKVFRNTVDAVRGDLEAGQYLDLMPSSGKFGKEAIEDKKPFYRKGIETE